jgi:putative aldouronate transport system permease protein
VSETLPKEYISLVRDRTPNPVTRRKAAGAEGSLFLAQDLRWRNTLRGKLRKYRVVYLLIAPALINLIIFSYLPMTGIIIAFKDYKVGQNMLQMFTSPLTHPWYKHFVRLVTDLKFFDVLRNTLIISAYRITLVFAAPIVFALLLNELRSRLYKGFVQTITYLPNFLSAVVVSGLALTVLSPTYGLVNAAIIAAGGQPHHFLADTHYFRGIIIGIDLWQTTGWNAIIYLAAIVGIDPELYEAAIVDGAGRFRRMWNITLPGIGTIAFIQFIIAIGNVLNQGSDSIFLLYSPAVYSVGDVIDTYVFREGILNSSYSYTAAVGLFKSAVGLVLVYAANRVTKMFGNEGVW